MSYKAQALEMKMKIKIKIEETLSILCDQKCNNRLRTRIHNLRIMASMLRKCIDYPLASIQEATYNMTMTKWKERQTCLASYALSVH